MTTRFGVRYYLVLLAFTLLSFGLKAQITAAFSATPLTGCAPLVVRFTDQSTGNPIQWKWDLGNGTISFLQNPSVTYFNPGQYNIKLVTYNAAGDSSVLIKPQYITIYAPPSVAFNGSPLTGCFPLPVNFTDQSTSGSGTITQWQWDFGDGITNNTQNPSHIYTAAGNYNVTLRVTNSFGCNKVLAKPQYVKINGGVKADFTNNTPSTCATPVTINFQNLSTGTGALTYQWSFGDGGTATTANPSHTYTNAGIFTVQLIVTNNTGCKDTITKTALFSIGLINAAFTSADEVCVNTPISFTNTSLPAPVAATWNFDDGNTATTINATHIYSNPGSYRVRLISDFGGCLDTTYKTIVVRNKPTAAFNAPVTAACKPPLTVNFNNTSTGAVSYQWNFGDGGTATNRNPSHTYTTAGTFTVTLIATNAFGCSDTLLMPDFVKIQAPTVSINALPRMGCAPLTHRFTATVNSVDPVVSYEWDFGNGNTSNLSSPTQTFAAGAYDIQLVITTAGGCTDTVKVIRGIVASIKPAANFTATPRDACAFTSINFSDLSTGTVTSWQWLFGDGGSSTLQNPTYEYQDTGYFDVTLIVCNEGCCDTLKFENYIHINPPIAAYDVAFDCAKPFERVFTDQSVGADEWLWNFGDGNTATTASPTHTYTATGTYNVNLFVKNNTTGCTSTKNITVTIVDEKAAFTASDTIVCKYEPIIFSPAGTMPNSNITTYEWTYGDGNAGNTAPASHAYQQAGVYTVQLIITDILGCKDTLAKNLHIRVDGPTAAFTPGITSTCLLSAVPFTDNSTTDGLHPIQTWIWNYGDGTTDTLTAPPFMHNYAAPGSYGVSLKVIDNSGCADSTAQNSTILISKPLAAFSSIDTLTCPTKLVKFINTSTGPGLTYIWNFGDGNTSTAADPTHSYAANGLYTIKLFVTDQYGCTDTLVYPDYIHIVSPQAAFTISDSLSTCPPLLVDFTNNSANAVSAVWDFGDGTSTQNNNPSHFYNYPGTYVAKLTVTGPGGCTHVQQKTIVVRGPQGIFSYSPINGCNPLTVNFVANTQDRLSFIWDFNDGTTRATPDSVLSYTYTIPGIYVPKMILVDPNGCLVPITGPDTIVVNGVAARFGLSGQTFCDRATVTFSDSSVSNDVIDTYKWDFGDGTTSVLQNPVHQYTNTGIYYPQLVVTTQSGCKDTAKNIAPIKIVSSPQADITGLVNGCVPLNVNFRGDLIAIDTSVMTWAWDLGNGVTSSLQHPPLQVYNNAGNYSVKLIATNSSGCKDTVQKSVDAFGIPVVNAGADTLLCRGKNIALTATGASNYIWSPSRGLSCVNCANPIATPDSLMYYTVRGTSAQGCANTDTVMINVKQRFNMLNSSGGTLCRGGNVRLFADGAHTYVWSPTTGLSNSNSPTPVATPTTTTTYQVIGTDDKKCFTDTGYVTVTVHPIPTVDAGQDKTINVGQSIELKPTLSADVTNAKWLPSPGIMQVNQNNIVVKPRETTEYTIEATNAGGCRSTDKVTVFVICNGSNIFVPNTFSPNGDGVNDIFYPRGTGLFTIKTLRVFSRWGEVMYEKNNFTPNDASAGWNGTFKGNTLTPDVYVYTIDVICDNNVVMTLKGNVALIK